MLAAATLPSEPAPGRAWAGPRPLFSVAARYLFHSFLFLTGTYEHNPMVADSQAGNAFPHEEVQIRVNHPCNGITSALGAPVPKAVWDHTTNGQSGCGV